MSKGRCRLIAARQSAQTQDLVLTGVRLLTPERTEFGASEPPLRTEAGGECELSLKGRGFIVGVTISGISGGALPPAPPSPGSPPPASFPTPGRPSPLGRALAGVAGTTGGAVLVGKLKGEPWADDVIETIAVVATSVLQLLRRLIGWAFAG